MASNKKRGKSRSGETPSKRREQDVATSSTANSAASASAKSSGTTEREVPVEPSVPTKLQTTETERDELRQEVRDIKATIRRIEKEILTKDKDCKRAVEKLDAAVEKLDAAVEKLDVAKARTADLRTRIFQLEKQASGGDDEAKRTRTHLMGEIERSVQDENDAREYQTRLQEYQTRLQDDKTHLRERLVKKEDELREARRPRAHIETVDNSGTKFVNFVLDNKRQFVGDEERVIEFIDAPMISDAFDASGAYHKKLYVRECYKDVLVAFDNEKKRQWRYRHVFSCVLTGTPGIGKSAFGVYVVCRRLLDGDTVYYEWQNNVWCFTPQRGATVTRISRLQTQHEVPKLKKPPWYIVDLGDARGEFPLELNAHSLVVSSPNAQRFRSWKKHMAACTMVMPRFKVDEMNSIRNECFNGVKDAEFDERLRKFGCSPRNVFSAAAVDDLWQEVCSAFETATSTANIFQWQRPKTDLDGTFPHRLYNLTVDSPVGNVRYEFASEYVKKGFAVYLANKKRGALISYLNSVSGSDIFSGLWGQMFEPLAIQCVAWSPLQAAYRLNGTRRTLSGFQRRNIQRPDVSIMKSDNPAANSMARWIEENDTKRHEDFIWPNTTNFEGIEAMSRDAVYQVTRKKERTVPNSNWLNACVAAWRQLRGDGRRGNMPFIYIVPEHHRRSFRVVGEWPRGVTAYVVEVKWNDIANSLREYDRDQSQASAEAWRQQVTDVGTKCTSTKRA